jgi:hypothetical protein
MDSQSRGRKTREEKFESEKGTWKITDFVIINYANGER